MRRRLLNFAYLSAKANCVDRQKDLEKVPVFHSSPRRQPNCPSRGHEAYIQPSSQVRLRFLGILCVPWIFASAMRGAVPPGDVAQPGWRRPFLLNLRLKARKAMHGADCESSPWNRFTSTHEGISAFRSFTSDPLYRQMRGKQSESFKMP